jgi:short-subunit dehydrogenase
MPQAKRYLLTSSGIGAALAHEQASKGHDLALAARREANLHPPPVELLARGAWQQFPLPTSMIAKF